jgi:alkylhydroperoxidase family enzyme
MDEYGIISRKGIQRSLLILAVIGASLAGLTPAALSDDRPADSEPFVPLLDNSTAWERLPDCESGGGAPLPDWARVLASSLPYTTAAVLELDGTYRASDEFDPRLRSRMRYVAARAIGSQYGMAYAEADLRRAGGTDADLVALQGDRSGLPAAERSALTFARKMTVAAHSVTDEEVAGLIAHFGERRVVAMVLQLAYANFLDRLVLALGVRVEEGGPLTSRTYGFHALSEPRGIPGAARPADSSTQADDPVELPELESVFGRDWKSQLYDDLQERLQGQKARAGRVSIPDWETVRDRLPPGMYPPGREMKIRWSLVVLGHQPQLGTAWLRCLRVFGREAGFDRVLGESMFWIVTRSLQCFY